MLLLRKHFYVWAGFLLILAKFSTSTSTSHLEEANLDQLSKLRDKNAETGQPIIFYSNECLQEAETLFKTLATVGNEIDSEGFLWFKFWTLNIDKVSGPEIPTQQSKPELWINYNQYPYEFKPQSLMDWILDSNKIKPWAMDLEEEAHPFRSANEESDSPNPAEADL